METICDHTREVFCFFVPPIRKSVYTGLISEPYSYDLGNSLAAWTF